jgi:transcriptional regulator with XRE-family HTH domain
LRDWRQRRHLSQLELGLRADVSSRHISFIETGRAQPSADMVRHIAEVLDVPLRERNSLLLAAGFAPSYPQHDLDDPALEPVRAVLAHVLKGHEPYPAVVVDRHWGMVAANQALTRLVAGVAPHLLEPPVNVLRLSLHPEGMAPRIVNLGEWRAHILARLGRQAVVSGDPALFTLHDELAAYPVDRRAGHIDLDAGAIAVPLQLATEACELSLISTATSFGAPADVTVSELSIESFYPADEETAIALRAMNRDEL